MSGSIFKYAAVVFVPLLCCGDAYAAGKTAPQPVVASAPPVESAKLQKCLKRADELPDIASVEATAWLKNGGANEAHLCRAFAQGNRGMHADAAREFWFLASFYEKDKKARDPMRAVDMHGLAAQEFLRAKDPKNAEAQYTLALKIAPNHVASLIGRADARIATERYWDAIDDLNHALKAKPDDIDTLRKRGLAWTRLDNPKNAQEDFERAEALEGITAEPAPAPDR